MTKKKHRKSIIDDFIKFKIDFEEKMLDQFSEVGASDGEIIPLFLAQWKSKYAKQGTQ